MITMTNIPADSDYVAASAKCKNCLSPIPLPDQEPDATIITCGKCGTEIGTYGDIKATLRTAARDYAIDFARNAFKRGRRKH
jgi:hypothetical protein